MAANHVDVPLSGRSLSDDPNRRARRCGQVHVSRSTRGCGWLDSAWIVGDPVTARTPDSACNGRPRESAFPLQVDSVSSSCPAAPRAKAGSDPEAVTQAEWVMGRPKPAQHRGRSQLCPTPPSTPSLDGTVTSVTTLLLFKRNQERNQTRNGPYGAAFRLISPIPAP